MALERANFSAFRTIVQFALVWFCLSSSLCLGWAAACNCGTPWTFLLPFFSYDLVYNLIRQEKILQKEQNLTELGHNKNYKSKNQCSQERLRSVSAHAQSD